MPKITLVEPQKKNLHRFNIFLDGVFGFGADEDAVVKFRLVSGKQLDNSELEAVLLETETGKLMGRMHRWFGIRMRSEKEIRKKLSIINYQLSKEDKEPITDLVIESLINNLKQKGLINDEVFARAWVESRARKKGWRVIQGELVSKGIGRDVIESIKYKVLSIKGEKETAALLLERKIRVWKNLPELEFKKKGIEFLMRRGFEYSVAKEVVEKFLEKEYT